MTHRVRSVPDFVYWMLFVVLISLHYYTKTQDTPAQGYVEFFIIVWLVSFIGLIALKLWVPERQPEVVDYDENLTWQHLDRIILGLLLVELTAIAVNLLGSAAVTAMWIPSLSLKWYDDILFNIGLVATAEESAKVLAIKALKLRLGDTAEGRAFSVSMPIAFWAVLHGYHAYAIYGEQMWLLIAAAFISGLIMYWVLKETRCIMSCYIIHGAYNALIILAQALSL